VQIFCYQALGTKGTSASSFFTSSIAEIASRGAHLVTVATPLFSP
jgi:hypothetical protein